MASRQFSASRRSATMKSSASVSENSGYLRSMARTQKPSRFRRFTRWDPMKPPAPHTSAFFIKTFLQREQATERTVQKEPHATIEALRPNPTGTLRTSHGLLTPSIGIPPRAVVILSDVLQAGVLVDR